MTTSVTEMQIEELLAQEGITSLQNLIHNIAVEKGFWSADVNHPGIKTGLIMAEGAELMEEFRNETIDWNKVTEEAADIVIRVMDLCGAHNLDLETAICRKVAKNSQRPVKHGKRF